MAKRELYIVRSNDANGIRFTNYEYIKDNREPSEFVLPDTSEASLDWLRQHSWVWITCLDNARYLLEDAGKLDSAPYAAVLSKLADYPTADKWALWLNDENGQWQILRRPNAETENPRSLEIVHRSTSRR